MDWTRIETSWGHFRGRIRNKWRRLTDEDLEVIAGRRDRLERKIHERYGFAQEHIRKEVDDWTRWQRFESGQERAPLELARPSGQKPSGAKARR